MHKWVNGLVRIMLTPSSVSFASGRVARDIIAGHWHTCAAMQTNEIYCWGDGNNGKLGDGSTNLNQVPGVKLCISIVLIRLRHTEISLRGRLMLAYLPA